MIMNTNESSSEGAQITLDIPIQDDRLFGGETIDDILPFLIRHPTESFSVTDLAETIEHSRPSVTKSLDVLVSNDLVREQRKGTRRLVQINPERVSLPDDPSFQIPQSEFREPVNAAVDRLTAELDDVVAVVLYGSIARGAADRRSDVDLWVLVRTDRLDAQQTANRIREELEGTEFDGDRYDYDIDVESLQAVPNYRSELREILRDGIVLHETEQFQKVRQIVFHGESDE